MILQQGQTTATDSGRLSERAALSSGSVREFDVSVNAITLHVTEEGEGPAILFCHGFPDTSYSWRRQMHAVARAGYRAIAPDMRGYGQSSAPWEASLYTPLQTTGDLVELLDALHIANAIVVGHDWGSRVAQGAALMRPDRFTAMFCMSVPYTPRGDLSFFEQMRRTGHQRDFYMFEQASPHADDLWADAATTIPGVLYWASGSSPPEQSWHPFMPTRSLYRKAPGPLPSWADPSYVSHNIAEFTRTGFHGGLNYYRAYEPYFFLSSAFKGAKITQPSFYLAGQLDGLSVLYQSITDAELRVGLPNLVDHVTLAEVGHWPQHEASQEVSAQIIRFADAVSANI